MQPPRIPSKLLWIVFVVALLTVMETGYRAVIRAAAEQPPKDDVRPELIVRDSYNMEPPHFSKDPTVKIDYDIVYVRAPRDKFVWPDNGAPTLMEPGADLMLLHPDGREELLVEGGSKGSVVDPFVSFDGASVYYAFFYESEGADIYKIHVPTRKIVRLTHDGGKPAPGTSRAIYRRGEDSMLHLMEHTGKAAATRDVIYNTGPCPAPGGKVVFTSNRNGFVPRKGSFTAHAFQLTVMDDDGANLETIGHFNLGCALHPVILTDGRIMFSTLENQGLRGTLQWAIWTIHPDGTNWAPLISNLTGGRSFHFQTQRSDGRAVVEMYYNINQAGFGSLVQLPLAPGAGETPFGPGDPSDPRNRPIRWLPGGKDGFRLPFSPSGIEVLTPFANDHDEPSPPSVRNDPKSPRVGRLTQPCGAPDNHVLTVWSPNLDVSRDGITGGVRRVGSDTGIYLIKAGQPVYEPGQMLLVKNDPKYHEQWPRPLVPYKRIYGIDQPRALAALRNDGKLSPHLPAGTPFGLVGTSSLYKRESATAGFVPQGSVTAVPSPKYQGHNSAWGGQGSDSGVYANSDIHAIRIVMQEPNLRSEWYHFYNHAHERLRILGEIPVRKFGRDSKGAEEPLDPDGNPDTSFLARIPANTSFTFQTIDKHGMVLNMAQTWHQVRPGEIRNDCGGCHAHSQKPTLFEQTAAAKADYPVFDLTKQTPLLTAKKQDQSGKKWDKSDETGLKFDAAVKDVEYWRDVKPILARSCAACHTKSADKPAGKLVLDDDQPQAVKQHNLPGNVPGTYRTLALADNPYGGMLASRYVRRFQSRGSPLIWKVFGKRMDGASNDPPPPPKGSKLEALRFAGSPMPPPEAVAGTYEGPDGKKIKVEALTDEDRLTLIRWIDLGCPIDLTFDASKPQARGEGYLAARTLPTVAVAVPAAGASPEPLRRILIGMHDQYVGLDMDSFQVVADFPIDGVAAGENLAKQFKPKTDGVWELTLAKPITEPAKGKLTVSIKDKQGNVTRVERSFSVATGR